MRFLVTGATGKVGNAVTRRLIERGLPDPGLFDRVNGEGARNVMLQAARGIWEARADNTKAHEELGVEFTPWCEAVGRTVEWMIETDRV